MSPEQSRNAAAIFNELAKNFVSLSEIFLQGASGLPTVVKEETKSSSTNHSTTTEKKKKVEKDPNAPKRNLSSYMLYSQAVRQETVKEHPDLKQPDIARLIGEKWNKLSEKEKAPYVKAAEKEKVRYDKESQQYKATLNGDEATLNGDEAESTPTKRKAVDLPVPVASADNNKEISSKKKSKKNKEEKSSSTSTSTSSNKKKSDKKSSK